MVIDSSAILAILFGEPEQSGFAEAIEAASTRLVSAVNALETAIVVESRKGASGGRELDLLLHRARVGVVRFTEEQYEIARQAWRRFGKGNHPAGLNMADCCAYALARTSGEPLLFKGRDLALTDVVPAIEPPLLPTFSRSLERAFRNNGFLNVQVADDKPGRFGPHGSKVEIYIADAAAPVNGAVNRKANLNGTPRILGCRKELREYFSGFEVGDAINILVLAENRIRLWCTRRG